MYNQEGQYPWHQYETITPGVFMAIEMELEPTKEQQSQQDAISA
jgi:hypothetical protein